MDTQPESLLPQQEEAIITTETIKPLCTPLMDEISMAEGLTPISNFRLNTAHISWRAVDQLGQQMYVKCALGPEHNERTANQFLITRGLLTQRITMEDQDMFRYPIPVRYGKVGGLAYIAEEFIEDPQLLIKPWAKAASKTEDISEPNLQVATESTDLLEANITRLAKTLAFLTRLNPNQTQIAVEKQSKLLDMYARWTEECERIYRPLLGSMFKANDVLQNLITPNMHNLVTGFHHGDCEPYHFIVGKSGHFLTDWEFAKHYGYFSYDAAYLIHRLWTKVRSPELAMSLMTQYLEFANLDEKEFETFKLMLATRVIGGWIDVKNDNSMTGGIEQISYQDWVIKGLY